MFPINRDPPATEDDAAQSARPPSDIGDWTPGCCLFFVLVLVVSSLGVGAYVWDRIANPKTFGEKRWIELGTILVPWIVSLLGTILCIQQIRRSAREGADRIEDKSKSVPIWPGCLLVVLFFFVVSIQSLVHRVQSDRIEPIRLAQVSTLTYQAGHRFQLQDVELLSPRKTTPGESSIYEDVAPIVAKGARGGPYLLCAAYDRYRQQPVGTIAYVDRNEDDMKQIARSLDRRYQWQYMGDFIPDPIVRDDKEVMSLWSAISALILSIGGFVLVGFQIKEAFKKK